MTPTGQRLTEQLARERGKEMGILSTAFVLAFGILLIGFAGYHGLSRQAEAIEWSDV